MKYRAVKLTVLVTLGLSAFGFLHTASTTVPAAETAAPQRSSANRRMAGDTKSARPANYSRFSHQTAAHQMVCNTCHKVPTANWKSVRKEDAAFPDVTDYPSHASCLNCHRQQFFKGAQPTICTICHTNPGPRNSNRHPFANPVELFDKSPKGQSAISQYEVFFPHDKHEGMFGQITPTPARLQHARFMAVSQPAKQTAATGCATCHQLLQPQGDGSDEYLVPPPKNLADDAFWFKKGTFMTAPQNHATCFSCHAVDGGLKPEPKDCDMCHKLSPADKLTVAQSDFDGQLAKAMTDKTTLEKWQRREAGKFRHEWFSHAELKCNDCHQTSAINTADGKGAKVAVLSCGGSGSGCHITQTFEDGGDLNLEINKRKTSPTFQCVKCHINEGKKALPESHAQALAAVMKKK